MTWPNMSHSTWAKARQTMLVGEQRVVAATRFVERAVHDALGRLSHLVLRNVEVLHAPPPVACPARRQQEPIQHETRESGSDLPVSA